ncbi:hypothetical protein C4E15_06745 [Achromobacter spanius]|uniref:Uncharacterized protein n=1 Tax=Achromobacter spanius TaxID=217203 RepID=A0A2S5GU60_9BURK|nr:hypothetical protein [Achromobacter spanius]PPA76486.1 hypothetical protein C4E15_06745 [Achromobacter spanius]
MSRIGPSFLSEIRAAGLGQGVAWSESGDVFFNEDITEVQRAAVFALLDTHDPTAPAPPAVPESVTKYQCCVVLARHGLLAPTDAYFDALPADDPRRLAWLMAATVQRNSESTLDAIAHLGLFDAQADAMFIEATQVE